MREIIYHRKLLRYGADILYSPGMQLEKDFLQHGRVSVFAHSIAVACACLLIARLLHRYLKIRLNERAPGPGRSFARLPFSTTGMCRTKATGSTAFSTPAGPCATPPAILPWERFERDMIAKHMFPLNLRPPVFRESIILCIADKLCAADETLTRQSRYLDISRRY